MENKRLMILSLSLILLIGFSLAVDNLDSLTNTANQLSEGVDNFTNAVNTETGEVDVEALGNLIPKTAFEQRVENINTWLENNVSWLGFIFRMTPELSWLFLFNFYFILVGITYLILNFPSFLPINTDKDKYAAYGIGTSIFLILLFLNVFLALSKLVTNLVSILWNKLLPAGIIIAIVVVVIFILLAIFAFPLLVEIVKLLTTLFKGKKEEKVKEDVEETKEEVKTVEKGSNERLDQLEKQVGLLSKASNNTKAKSDMVFRAHKATRENEISESKIARRLERKKMNSDPNYKAKGFMGLVQAEKDLKEGKP